MKWWMFFASPAELRKYVNNRSAQAIYAYLGKWALEDPPRQAADLIRRTVKARAFLTPDAA